MVPGLIDIHMHIESSMLTPGAFCRRLAECGVRMLTLTWNGENELGSGNETEKGLTQFGRGAVAALEAAGIVIDVSHLNDRGFWDLTQIVSRPLVASHSDARAVRDHPRNLTDDQFCWIVRHGGLVGINYCTRFLTPEGDPGLADC